MNNNIKLFPFLIQFKLIVLLNFLDVILTVAAIEIFGAQEINPIMNFLLRDSNSFISFAIVKICVLYTALIYCLHRWYKKGESLLNKSMWTGISCIYGIIVLWNLTMISFGLYDLIIVT
jgi:hypothetical protein